MNDTDLEPDDIRACLIYAHRMVARMQPDEAIARYLRFRVRVRSPSDEAR
jgi:hypothetical protein